MTVLIYILFVLLILTSVAIIGVVLMQDAKSSGLGGAFGGGNTDNFFGRNKSKSREGRLQFLTKALAISIGVVSVALALLVKVNFA